MTSRTALILSVGDEIEARNAGGKQCSREDSALSPLIVFHRPSCPATTIPGRPRALPDDRRQDIRGRAGTEADH